MENEELLLSEERDEEVKEAPDYSLEIVEFLKGDASPKAISQKLEDYHANDIARAIPLLTSAQKEKIYRLLTLDQMSEILEYVEDTKQFISEINIRKAAQILENSEADTAAEIINELDTDRKQLIMDLLSEESRREISLISSYSEEEIGSMMTTNFITIKYNMTIKEAMKSLIEQAQENDNISTLYVLDENDIFYGAIDLKDLILSRESTILESIVVTSYPYVYANELIEDSIEKLRDYYEDSIPVLSNDNHILGVITSRSIIDAVDEEMAQDYAQLAGLTEAEDMNEPLTQSMRKRLPWLIALLILGLVVSSVVGIFESVVAALPIVMCFQSMVLDMSGNSGTQSLAVTIRVISDQDLDFKQTMKLLLKEVKVGLSNGLLLGTVAFAVTGCYIHFLKTYAWGFSFMVAACIAVSLLIAMTIASCMGTTIPMFFKKIGVDPAVASGPLITTINDLVAVITYYGMSWVLLINMLGLA